jgi:hypothetical protein
MKSYFGMSKSTVFFNTVTSHVKTELVSNVFVCVSISRGWYVWHSSLLCLYTLFLSKPTILSERGLLRAQLADSYNQSLHPADAT